MISSNGYDVCTSHVEIYEVGGWNPWTCGMFIDPGRINSSLFSSKNFNILICNPSVSRIKIIIVWITIPIEKNIAKKRRPYKILEMKNDGVIFKRNSQVILSRHVAWRDTNQNMTDKQSIVNNLSSYHNYYWPKQSDRSSHTTSLWGRIIQGCFDF